MMASAKHSVMKFETMIGQLPIMVPNSIQNATPAANATYITS